MDGVKGALTRKLGPLPAWGWGVAIGGSILLFRVVTGKGAFPAASSGGGASVGASGQAAGPIIPGSETSALSQLSASDLAALWAAAPAGVPGPKGATGAQGIPGLPAPSVAPKPVSTSAPPPTTVDFAGAKTPFGTRYPDYIHTYADALAWIQRAIRNGSKPTSSISISTTPVR